MRRKADPTSKLIKEDASFIAPMDCLPAPEVSEGPLWVYEVKLDGYRAIGVNTTQRKVHLFSRSANSLNRQLFRKVKGHLRVIEGTVEFACRFVFDTPQMRLQPTAINVRRKTKVREPDRVDETEIASTRSPDIMSTELQIADHGHQLVNGVPPSRVQVCHAFG